MPTSPALRSIWTALTVTSLRGALHIGDLSDVQALRPGRRQGPHPRDRLLLAASRCAAHDDPRARRDDVRSRHRRAACRHDGARCGRDDAETRAALRAGVGRPLLAPGNPAGAAIARSSPTRVFASALARLEVHQPIPPPGGRSPEGPHSHLLPQLSEGRAGACSGIAAAGWFILRSQPISPDTTLALPRRPPWTTRPAPNSKPPPFAGWSRICRSAPMCRIST